MRLTCQGLKMGQSLSCRCKPGSVTYLHLPRGCCAALASAARVASVILPSRHCLLLTCRLHMGKQKEWIKKQVRCVQHMPH